jgi:DNA-binding beta-propeller fold protein YncE
MPVFRRRHLCSVAAALALTVTVPTTAATAATPGSSAALREVLFVGNNWDGTADVIRSTGDFAKIGRINVIPDKDERMTAINADPIRWIYFMAIRNSVGEGHDQFVDDMYSTPDGKSVVVSRPSFADVVSIDLASGRLNWRFPVSGYRSDHMAVSPDGKRVAVSASTSNTVHVLDIVSGRELGKFGTGDKPHENIFTEDGKYIYNMAIGDVNTQTDAPWLDWTKGDRRITVVDATTYKQVKVIDMRPQLDALGLKDHSDAVRPAVFSPDESKLYFQVSFFNGFFEYDIATAEITRTKTLPKNPATSDDRTTFVNDSRHHGISMSPDGR